MIQVGIVTPPRKTGFSIGIFSRDRVPGTKKRNAVLKALLEERERMVRFWDTSALVTLLVDESQTDYSLGSLVEDQEMLVWCLIRVEVMSALCCCNREGVLADVDFRHAKARLTTILENVYEIKAIEAVRDRACRLLEVHPLRVPLTHPRTLEAM